MLHAAVLTSLDQFYYVANFEFGFEEVLASHDALRVKNLTEHLGSGACFALLPACFCLPFAPLPWGLLRTPLQLLLQLGAQGGQRYLRNLALILARTARLGTLAILAHIVQRYNDLNDLIRL